MPRRYTDHDLAKIRNSQGENIPVPPPPRKKPGNEESRIQADVIKWWATAHEAYGIPEFLLFAIPNGGYRNVITAAILKREGLRKGTSDLFLAVKRGSLGGMWIEMKRPKGVLSPDQIEFCEEVVRQGYFSTVCHTWSGAATAIDAYLKIK